jgi:soluble lytic murein transglycosylase-like protein
LPATPTNAIHRGRSGADWGRLAATAILATVSFSAPRPAIAADDQACEREMARAARVNDIPLNVLYAVGLTETGRKGALNPFDMNVDGRTVTSTSLNEALAKFNAERAKGAQLIDIGCMQINHRWHAADFRSLTDMFDPASNVRYAANFLKELRQREGSWTLAVARYNAGPNNEPAQKKYVCAVIRNMVASGMGQWTPNARAFCG